MTFVVIIFSMYMIWITRDLSPLNYLIPSVFAETAAATGFYFNKAKRENEIKLGKIVEEEVKAYEDYK